MGGKSLHSRYHSCTVAVVCVCVLLTKGIHVDCHFTPYAILTATRTGSSFFKVFFIGGFTRKAVSLIAQCKMAVTFVECQLGAFIYVSFYFL